MPAVKYVLSASNRAFRLRRRGSCRGGENSCQIAFSSRWSTLVERLGLHELADLVGQLLPHLFEQAGVVFIDGFGGAAGFLPAFFGFGVVLAAENRRGR